MNNRFRKQFIFGPAELLSPHFADWPSLPIGKNVLKRHPALQQHQAESEARKVIFLGFAVHCEHPEFSEQNIAEQLAGCTSDEAFLNELDALCGTFVVIESVNDQLKFYNDISSSGKLFYLNGAGGVLLGSDPKILAEVVSLKRDESDAAKAFYSSAFFNKPRYKKWLGNRTWYESLFQVLPNHGFDYSKQQVFRYYPRKERKELPVNEIIAESARILRNISKATFLRNNAYVSLTAGWDSRVIMASTKEFSDRATYYTFRFNNGAVNEKDVRIAKRICADLGLKHILPEPYSSVPEEHANDIEASFELRNDARYLSFLKLFEGELVDTIAVTGSISEIAKNYFERLPIRTGAELAKAAHFPELPYVVSYFQQWIYESKDRIERLGYTPQDFAHWEQDIANFAGQGILSTSYVANRISPFNCRKLIDTILQANISYRDGYNNVVYRGIIKELWPELLNYPVNPTLKVKMINWSKKLGIYPVYKQLQQRINRN